MNNQQIAEFFTRCEALDWYFEMSDDYKVCEEGRREKSILWGDCKKDPITKRMFDDWNSYMHSGISGAKVKRPVLQNYLINED